MSTIFNLKGLKNLKRADPVVESPSDDPVVIHEWIKATPERIASMITVCSGRQGDGESETVISWTKRRGGREGYVTFFTTYPSHAALVLRRCGSAVIEMRKRGDSIWLRISVATEAGRRVFRGVEKIFAPVDIDARSMPVGIFGSGLEDPDTAADEEDSSLV